MNGKIRTVLGDIEPSQLGVTDCHDHLIRTGGYEIRLHKDFLMDSVEAAAAEFKDFLDAGGNSMVCCDPLGSGRNVPKMLEVAKQFGENAKGNIIMVTGFHKEHFYDKRNSFLAVTPIEDVIKMTVAEIEEGMDEYSYAGPVVKRVAARAGVIKAGTGYDGITPFENKSLEVAAKTSKQTGCPIIIHTQLGTYAYEVAIKLQKFGAHPDRIMLSHLNKNPDKYYYKKVLDTGVSIAFDGPDRVKYYPDITLAENIKWLVEKGYQKQLTLAMDAGRTYYQHHYSILRGGHESEGIKYLLTRFVPLLREIGVPGDAIEDMLVNNPREWLTFKK